MKEPVVTGNAGAARVAGFRQRHARLDVNVDPQIGQTIEDLAAAFDTSKNEVVTCMLRWALTNRDWKRQGLVWRKR